MKPANFDGLATIYRALEYLAFGRDLERARFCLLDQLADCRSILILGEGDGRCLERLLPLAPQARIHCIDASQAMLTRIAKRIASLPSAHRVTLQHADALTANLSASAYDAAVTLFFLDCFTPDQAAQVVAKVSGALDAKALWLFADFALPPVGLARLRARVWLRLLYFFFRWRTGIAARQLPPSEALLAEIGFHVREVRARQSGLLRTVLFTR